MILLLLTALTVWLGYQVKQSRFDYEFEKFFPKGNEETEYFEQFRKQFENDYDFLLIGVENQQGVFQPGFLQRIEALADSLRALDNVNEVYTPTGLRLPIRTGLTFGTKKVLRTGSREDLIIDSARIYETREFVGSFFSEDARSVCLVVMTKEQMAKKPSDRLIGEVEALIGRSDFDQVHLAGKIKAQQVYLSRMQKEIVFFLAVAIFFVIIFLGLTFQSVLNVTLPILVVLLSITWQLGFMHLVGKRIDILCTLLPTVLFVIGMSDVIHILSKYIEELRSGLPKLAAIRETLKNVGLATFLTSFTTALGFFSLITSDVGPIREFGIYTSVGVLVAFFLSIVMLPAVMVIFPAPRVVSNERNERFWHNFLRNRLLWIFKHPRLIVGVFIAVGLVATVGAFRIRVNNYLLEDLRPHEPLKKEFSWFENNYSGGRPFELVVTVADSQQTLLDYDNMLQLQKLETASQEYFGTGFMQSPLGIVRIFHRAINSGKNEYFTLPPDRPAYDSLIRVMHQNGVFEQTEVQRFLSADRRTARISGKMKDVGSYRMGQMEKKFLAFTAGEIDPHRVQYRLTGSARLVDQSISYISINLVQGEILAFLIISVLFAVIFRSLRMLAIALLTNTIPLVIIAGIMGFTGIELKFSTSIIFTIAFGIAVDDTIHFLSRYGIEQRKGRSNLYAIKRSYLSTGKAMILTALVLIAGFMSMVTSSFMSVFYIGLLISTTLVLAVLSDLFLLPVLLVFWTGKKSQKSKFKS